MKEEDAWGEHFFPAVAAIQAASVVDSVRVDDTLNEAEEEQAD